jgi:membrane-associated phospholipid phosphatase
MFDLFAEPNAKAAMPSLHFAGAFIVVIVATILRSKRLAAGALAYSTLLSFALMYLGEHYFADILVGGLVALASAFIVETALGNGPGARWALRAQRWIVGSVRRRAARTWPSAARRGDLGEVG